MNSIESPLVRDRSIGWQTDRVNIVTENSSGTAYQDRYVANRRKHLRPVLHDRVKEEFFAIIRSSYSWENQ